MTEAYRSGPTRDAICYEGGNAAALGAANWLRLAATPTFAIMALLTGVSGGGMPDMFCSAAISPLNGMTLMYVMMSVFHSTPWLKLFFGRRNGGAGP